jgi:hypothetical protein
MLFEDVGAAHDFLDCGGKTASHEESIVIPATPYLMIVSSMYTAWPCGLDALRITVVLWFS